MSRVVIVAKHLIKHEKRDNVVM